MKDYRNNYYSKCSEVLNAHREFIEKMTDEYQYATDDAYTVGIEKGINDEYCDVLQPLGIESKVCFRKYYTSVDNMLSLYEKYGSPQKSIRAVITAAIDEEISVSDIFENYYEYKDDDTFNSRFNYESEKLLDEFYENLVDEEDGVFEGICHINAQGIKKSTANKNNNIKPKTEEKSVSSVKSPSSFHTLKSVIFGSASGFKRTISTNL